MQVGTGNLPAESAVRPLRHFAEGFQRSSADRRSEQMGEYEGIKKDIIIRIWEDAGKLQSEKEPRDEFLQD